MVTPSIEEPAVKSLAAFAALSTALGAATAADAAVTVIGSSPARMCYEAARSPERSVTGIDECDTALASQSLDKRDEVATYVNRGILRATHGDVTGAMKDYDSALALDRDEPEAWLNKAFATLRNGDAAGAVPLFDAAVARHTAEPALAHYGRGVAHEQAGDVRAAYADYVRARDLRPGWSAPRTELVRFKVDRRPAQR